MAKQIKFFSQTAVPTGTDATIGGNVYFVNGDNNGNEIYKGAVRFGAPRVTKATTSSALSAIAGMIRGDINVGYQGTKVYDGENWQTIASSQSALRTSWIDDINDAVDGLIYNAAPASSTGDPIPGYNLVTAITGTSNADGVIELSAVVSTFQFGPAISYSVVTGTEVDELSDLGTEAVANKLTTAGAVFNALSAYGGDIASQLGDKASKGTGNATGAHGVSGTFTLKSNSATHTFTLDVKSAALATNFSTSDYFTTGSIVYGHTSGLVTTGVGNKSYIKNISYDSTTGKLSATGGTFGDAALKGVVTASGSFKASTYSTYLPVASAVAAYVDGNVTTLNNAIDTKASVGSGNADPSYGVSGYFTLNSNISAHEFVLYVNPITTSGEINSETSLPTGKAVKDYVDGKVTAMGNVLVFKDTSYDSSATYAKGDVILFAADDTTWGINASGVAASGGDITIPFTQGLEIVCIGSSAGEPQWEVIGNQNKWVDKVTGGTSTSTNNNVTVKVTTDAVTAKPTVLVTAPAYDPTEVTKSGSNNGTTVSVTTKNGQVTAVAVTASNWTPADGASTSSNNGVTVSVSTKAGVLDKVLVTAPAYTATSAVKSDADNGVNVAVSTVNGQVKVVDVVVSEAALATNFNTSSYLTTGSTVYAHTSGLAQGTTGSYIEQITYTNGKLTATAKALPTVGNGASTTTSYGVTISASTVAGVQKSANITVAPVTTSAGITAEATTSLATAAAIKAYVDGKIGAIDIPDDTKGDSDKGVQVSVTTTNGVVTSVDVQTTLQTTIATTNTDNEIPSAKAVSNALCWYKQDGSTLW